METTRLEMIFFTEEGKKATISIQDPKEDVTAQEVETVMGLIVDKDVLTSKGKKLEQIASARLVTRGVEEILPVNP
ncbi:MAG: DUF2922 domain-containing protein [Bacillota bacterium]